MTVPTLLSASGKYPGTSFKPVATQAWLNFFQNLPSDSDIAYCVIEADSATVMLSPRNSHVDENGRDWRSPAVVVGLVDGILECFEISPKTEHAQLRESFYQWASGGILESFLSSRISKLFHRIIGGRRFEIVTTRYDEGLAGSELDVLWANGRGVSLRSIAHRQSRARRSSSGPKKAKKVR